MLRDHQVDLQSGGLPQTHPLYLRSLSRSFGCFSRYQDAPEDVDFDMRFAMNRKDLFGLDCRVVWLAPTARERLILGAWEVDSEDVGFIEIDLGSQVGAVCKECLRTVPT